MGADQAVVPVQLQEAVWDQHPGVSPAHRANPRRRRVQPAAAYRPFSASRRDPARTCGRRGNIVHQVPGGVEENLRVAAPAVTIPGGAVRGYVQGIAFHRPKRCMDEPVQQLIGAAEEARLPPVRIDSNGLDVLRADDHVGVHLRAAEAEDREGHAIAVLTLGACVVDGLQGRGVLALDALDVAQGQAAVPVRQLAAADADALSGPGLHAERHPARQTLPEVEQPHHVGGDGHRGSETFMLRYRHAVGGGGDGGFPWPSLRRWATDGRSRFHRPCCQQSRWGCRCSRPSCRRWQWSASCRRYG